MASTLRYAALAERSGGWWAVRVPDAPGVFTQARRLAQVEGMARDALAAMLDVSPETIDVTVEPVLPEEAEEALRSLTKARTDAESANRMLSEWSVRAARALVDSGLTVRDAGRIMGVSYQRVDQLIHKLPEAS